MTLFGVKWREIGILLSYPFTDFVLFIFWQIDHLPNFTVCEQSEQKGATKPEMFKFTGWQEEVTLSMEFPGAAGTARLF